MPVNLSTASFQLGQATKGQRKPTPAGPGERMHIVVFGDFTGRANRGLVEPLDAHKLLLVDCDNFETAFARLGAKLELAVPGLSGSTELTFETLRDFHPDVLLARTASLSNLMDTRRRSASPGAGQSGDGIESVLASGGKAKGSASEQDETNEQTFERLLGRTEAPDPKPPASGTIVEQLIRQAVATDITPPLTPSQEGALAATDLELAAQLRAVLHSPQFQSMEAAWRGVDFLIRRIEADDEVAILLLDLSIEEFEANLLGEHTTDEPPLYRLLRERNVSFMVGDYAFGKTEKDLQALTKMAQIASFLEAPFIATAHPGLVGCESFGSQPDPHAWTTQLKPSVAETWNALRVSREAMWIGLAAPRFLLRQPYGTAGDPIDAFSFEELSAKPTHEEFLWGHPGFLCASLLAEAFLDEDDAPGSELVDDMPVHIFTEDGERVIQPYAEAWLTDRAADTMMARGLMPLLSRKDVNAIQIPRLQSISDPPAGLRARRG